MPIDASIPMGFQFPKFDTDLEKQTKALTLQDLIARQQQHQMAVEEAKRKAALEERFTRAREALPSDAGLDQHINLGLRYARDPKDVATLAERAQAHAASRQIALMRLSQDMRHKLDQLDVARRNATTAEQKAAVMQAEFELKKQEATFKNEILSGKTNYDYGFDVKVPDFSGIQPKPVGSPSIPSGSVLNLGEFAPGSAEGVASVMAMLNGPVRATVNEPWTPEASAPTPMQQPAQQQAPFAPAPPNNLDARDLRLQTMQPQQAAPVAAPAARPAIPSMPPEIAAAPQRVQNQWRLQQTRTSIAGGGTLNPETLQFVAKQYLTGDRQAVQGFARNATARIALQNAIVDEARIRGMTPEQTAAQIADFAGTMAGSRTVGQRAANISLAATEAEEMLGIVKETSDKFARTNFVPWNMALRAYESGTGSPEIAEFGAAVNALVNVYARAINPTGVPTVSDKEHARAVLNTVQSPPQVDAVLGIIKRELAIAKKAPAAVQAATRARVSGQGAGTFSDPEKERRYQEWKKSQGL